MGTVLIQDPHHEYASRFVRLIRERYGHRAIAFFTRSRKERFYRRRDCLPESEFAAVYQMDPADVDGFAAQIRARHHDLRAVIPYSEETLELTAALQERLGLGWNDGAILARFRQKAALKDHLRRTAPSVRLNFSRAVSSAAEVFAIGDSLPAKFVLKPDSGYGSRGVGIFTRDQRAGVEQFCAGSPDRYLLEEFLEGTLYAIDGLVDAKGEVLVASVFSSGRQQRNGSPVVYANGALVQEDTPLFGELAAYARAVVAASGLKRSPFHLEAIRDARGPCLIEVGARLIGHSHAFTCERVHGGAFDFFGLSAAGYLGEPMDLRLSFAHYNRLQAVKVYGASDVKGAACRVEGVEAVEALPSFDRWIVKPQVGSEVRRTVDLFSVPYSLVLVGPRDGEPLTAAGEAVHRMLRIETNPSSTQQRLRLEGTRFAARAAQKLSWMAERGRRSLSLLVAPRGAGIEYLRSPMRRRASFVIGIVLVGHLAALALQRELWPFSHYPMYAKAQTEWTFEAHRLYGISAAGEEVSLEPGGDFEPYGASGISEVLATAKPDPEKLDTALRSLLSWYQAGRPVHGGPPIRALRAYRVVYSLSRQLDPRKRERATVLSRVLLAETAR